MEMEERVAQALRPNEGSYGRKKPVSLIQQMATKRQSAAMIGADGVLRTDPVEVPKILAEHWEGIMKGAGKTVGQCEEESCGRKVEERGATPMERANGRHGTQHPREDGPELGARYRLGSRRM